MNEVILQQYYKYSSNCIKDAVAQAAKVLKRFLDKPDDPDLYQLRYLFQFTSPDRTPSEILKELKLVYRIFLSVLQCRPGLLCQHGTLCPLCNRIWIDKTYKAIINNLHWGVEDLAVGLHKRIFEMPRGVYYMNEGEPRFQMMDPYGYQIEKGDDWYNEQAKILRASGRSSFIPSIDNADQVLYNASRLSVGETLYNPKINRDARVEKDSHAENKTVIRNKRLPRESDPLLVRMALERFEMLNKTNSNGSVSRMFLCPFQINADSYARLLHLRRDILFFFRPPELKRAKENKYFQTEKYYSSHKMYSDCEVNYRSLNTFVVKRVKTSGDLYDLLYKVFPPVWYSSQFIPEELVIYTYITHSYNATSVSGLLIN